MWDWIENNQGSISAFASLATLCVWLAYLQLFYNSYRHRLRSKLMITRGGGHSLTSRCMLTNMSAEIAFIQAVIVELTLTDRQLTCSLSDIDRSRRDGHDPRSELFQGPVLSGEYLDLGSFEDLAAEAMRSCHHGPELADVREMAVTAVGTYTWHDRIVAAERSFKVSCERGQRLLKAESAAARQVRSRRRLRRIARIMEAQSGRSIVQAEA